MILGIVMDFYDGLPAGALFYLVTTSIIIHLSLQYCNSKFNILPNEKRPGLSPAFLRGEKNEWVPGGTQVP
jgi:hypothetical protein